MPVTTWRGKDGQVAQIKDMPNDHLVNAYKYLIRMVCTKVKDLDSADAALEDEKISSNDHDYYYERNRRDLLDLIEQKDSINAEMRRRKLRLT